MNKIQKERVQKSFYDVYVANDGTEFRDMEECKKYEESAKCVLLVRYREIVVKSSNEYELFGFGSEDCTIDVVKPRVKEDIDLLLRIYLLENPYMADEEYKERVNKMVERMNLALNDNDFIFIGRGCCDDGFYFEGTRNEHVQVLNRIGEPEKKDE